MKKLDSLLKEFRQELSNDSLKKADILNLKSQYLGKQGVVTEIFKTLKNLSSEERRETGPLLNQIKSKILQECDDKMVQFEMEEVNRKLEAERIDVELTRERKEKGFYRGGYHPRTLVQQEIEDIFLSMGFHILDGPHIDDEFYNFEALNIPSDHPARDMQDTFWFQDGKHLLRTHTSTLQVRGMQSYKPPFRFIAPGMVFRSERTDASHEMAFTQIEGMMVTESISVANLIYFMKTLLSEIFRSSVKVRLRPGFFPFVEPGFELDISCLICGGKGCRVCKQSGWVELCPCGMVHPNVLRQGGIDPAQWSGFAFGLGLDRLVMMRYGIDDIRHLARGDLRFHSQFRAY